MNVEELRYVAPNHDVAQEEVDRIFLATVEELRGMSDEAHKRGRWSYPKVEELRLCALHKRVFGTEADITSVPNPMYPMRSIALLCDAYDTYAPTIAFCYVEHRYMVTTFGDLYEGYIHDNELQQCHHCGEFYESLDEAEGCCDD